MSTNGQLCFFNCHPILYVVPRRKSRYARSQKKDCRTALSLILSFTPSPWTYQPFRPQSSTGAASRRPRADHYHIIHPHIILSAIFYYFGRKPFLLKQKRPLIIPQKFSRILLDCMKRLFSGYRKHKTTKKEPTQLPIAIPATRILPLTSPLSKQFPLSGRPACLRKRQTAAYGG